MLRPIIDSHAHLDADDFKDDVAAVIARATEVGVENIVTVGCTVASSHVSWKMTATHPSLFCTAGIHPHEADKFDDTTWHELEMLWRKPRVVGVGETGLDYYYNFSARDRQQMLFRRQLEAAGEVALPIVIHVRDAFDDAFRLIEDVTLPSGGILHCFTGGPSECERALALGLHISLSGIATFPKATQIHAAIPLIPLDKILIETDAPYLAPIPHRGKRNEPAYLRHTAERVATLRGVSLDELCRVTYKNTRTLFRFSEKSGASVKETVCT